MDSKHPTDMDLINWWIRITDEEKEFRLATLQAQDRDFKREEVAERLEDLWDLGDWAPDPPQSISIPSFSLLPSQPLLPQGAGGIQDLGSPSPSQQIPYLTPASQVGLPDRLRFSHLIPSQAQAPSAGATTAPSSRLKRMRQMDPLGDDFKGKRSAAAKVEENLLTNNINEIKTVDLNRDKISEWFK